MARIFKEDEYMLRRNEILDTAIRLVYTKGYEQMSIQDILQERQISKGAFYHYFDSKGELLEAIIDRMTDDADVLLQPILQDENLPALAKLQKFFDTAGRWKVAQKALFMPMLRVWYDDDNAIVRQKVNNTALDRIGPMIDQIIGQGISEGVFKVAHAAQLGEVSLSLLYNAGEKIVSLLLSPQKDQQTFDSITELVFIYTRSVERILGAPDNSIVLVEPEILQEWFEAALEVQS